MKAVATFSQDMVWSLELEYLPVGVTLYGKNDPLPTGVTPYGQNLTRPHYPVGQHE